MHVIHSMYENQNCQLSLRDPASIPPSKIYTIKELVTMDTAIDEFHTSLYIPEVQNLVFHLLHVCIIGKHHCGNTRREAFKRLRLF